MSMWIEAPPYRVESAGDKIAVTDGLGTIVAWLSEEQLKQAINILALQRKKHELA